MLNTDDLRHYTGIGTGYSPEMMMNRAADEIEALRYMGAELLEILRGWKPDNESAAERGVILRAMYKIGVLSEPTEMLRKMTEADFTEAHG